MSRTYPIRPLVRRSLRHPLAALALLLTAARALAAQDARPTASTLPAAAVSAATVEARLAAIADTALRASIGAFIAEASRRGLPAEPLVTKALEGVEKNAPPPRIEAAVRAMAGRLLTASSALAPALTVTDLKAGADALGAGVPADVLRHVREASGNRSAAVALGVVAQLTARGVPPDAAGDAVVYLVKRGAGHGHLLRLQQEVQADLAIGMAASRSLDLRMRTLTTSLPPPVQPAAATADAEAGPQLMGGTPRTTPTTPRKKP